MTDSDNTGETVRSCYRNIKLATGSTVPPAPGSRP
jgi:hypothetical protein